MNVVCAHASQRCPLTLSERGSYRVANQEGQRRSFARSEPDGDFDGACLGEQDWIA